MWRRWGTPHNVFLAFIDKLEKQIIIKKTVEVGQQKTNNFNIYNVAFFLKKITKNTCRYHYQNLEDMIYSSWDIEQNKQKLVILGNFFAFIPLKTPISKFWKMKKFDGHIIILRMCTKNHNHMMYGSWDTDKILDHFLPFYPLWTQKLKTTKKNGKNTEIYYHFTNINDSHMMYG